MTLLKRAVRNRTGTAAAPAKLRKLEAHQRACLIDNGFCQDGTLAHCFVCARVRGMLKGADILMHHNVLSLEQEAKASCDHGVGMIFFPEQPPEQLPNTLLPAKC